MESQLLRKFYYLLLKSTLWSFYYLLLRKFYCLLPHKPQWSRNPYSLPRRSNKQKMVQHFCFSSHSWSVKLDVRSNFIYNPDLYNYVIIYIMKISSTLFSIKRCFSQLWTCPEVGLALLLLGLLPTVSTPLTVYVIVSPILFSKPIFLVIFLPLFKTVF